MPGEIGVTDVKIGTRASILAVSQAESVQSALDQQGMTSTLVRFETKGDQILDRALDKIGDKGLFTTELERALLSHEIDLAVHSLKDLPTEMPPGLFIAAYALAEDPRDVFLGRDVCLDRLSDGSVVGTSSLRRTAWLRHICPNVTTTAVRGNLHTRISKWREHEWAGLILAAAGVHRLGWQALITEYLDPKEWVPAPGQGILAIQMRDDHPRCHDIKHWLNDGQQETRAIAEREVLARLGGGCQIPLGVYAELDVAKGLTHVVGKVVSPDGSRAIVTEATDAMNQAVRVGRVVAEDLLRKGAHELIGLV